MAHERARTLERRSHKNVHNWRIIIMATVRSLWLCMASPRELVIVDYSLLEISLSSDRSVRCGIVESRSIFDIANCMHNCELAAAFFPIRFPISYNAQSNIYISDAFIWWAQRQTTMWSHKKMADRLFSNHFDEERLRIAPLNQRDLCEMIRVKINDKTNIRNTVITHPFVLWSATTRYFSVWCLCVLRH